MADDGRRGSPVREKILHAADELFYADGLRAVSADKIIARAGVSKVTFYRHFRTKDDLIVAYLRGRSDAEREVLEGLGAAQPDDPRRTLRRIAVTIGRISCAAGFRGCPFLNAAAEYPDPDSAVRHEVTRHRDWYAGYLVELLLRLGITQADSVAARLVMLRDGAMVAGYMSHPEDVEQHLLEAGRAIVGTAETEDRATPG